MEEVSMITDTRIIPPLVQVKPNYRSAAIQALAIVAVILCLHGASAILSADAFNQLENWDRAVGQMFSGFSLILFAVLYLCSVSIIAERHWLAPLFVMVIFGSILGPLYSSKLSGPIEFVQMMGAVGQLQSQLWPADILICALLCYGMVRFRPLGSRT